MKCIKAIRETSEVKLGTIKRVDNKTATNMVGLTWAYIPKSEWKSATRTEKKDEPVKEQVEKKPYKKGERSEKHKNKK